MALNVHAQDPLIMSHVWFSPATGPLNKMDEVRNPNHYGHYMPDKDRSVIDEPPAARTLAVATASGAPIQRLSEHLLD